MSMFALASIRTKISNALVSCPSRIDASLLRLAGSLALASVLASCAGTPTDTSKHVAIQRILPSAGGFVICVDCEPFQSTVKRHDAPAKTPTTRLEQPVSVAQSLSTNEQIVSVPLRAPVTKARSIAILFNTNQTRILPSEAQKLRTFLNSTPDNAAFTVTGYTDGTGNRAANVKLAERRAQSVKAFVIRSTHSRKISISRAANCCPEAQDLTESERAKNRHVELSVVP